MNIRVCVCACIPVHLCKCLFTHAFMLYRHIDVTDNSRRIILALDALRLLKSIFP